MKTLLVGMTLALCAASVHGQVVTSAPTPAEQKIVWARTALGKDPGSVRANNVLAMALTQRARETANPEFYAQAEQALEKSFAIAAENYEGRRIRAWILLGKHEFAAALAEAQSLNRLAPDDVMVYGFLVDAHTHLGDYVEAEKAAQWMLDIRPGNVPGLTRAAHLRELFGDVEGALELMATAFQQTPQRETEDRAWLLTQMGHLHLSLGHVETAESILRSALQLFPGYHYALAQMAAVRTAQGRNADAVALLRTRYEGAPHPENLFDLGEALDRAGMKTEARAAFAKFEQTALAESARVDNANRELIYYYTDYARKPAEALRIAKTEAVRRQDAMTLAAYAWALHSAGKAGEAFQQVKAALAVGIRDARMFYQAGMIARGAGDQTAASRFLRDSLEVNSRSTVAAAAREELQAIATAASKARK